MLQVDNIVTKYGKIEALKGASLTVDEGQVTCLLGPNGAGKTTLMFTIAGILKPSQGSIQLDGVELAGSAPIKMVEAGIALVPENRLVFPEMSVRDNLRAGAYTRLNSDKVGVEEDIARMFARFPQLGTRETQLAGTMSGGEQQMLAIARALMSRPKILLMDEPSLGLAPLIVQEIFDLITELNAEGTTIFLVEQNANMALQVAHKFYLLEQGQVTFGGTPDEMEENTLIQRAYLGSVGE
ncbi:MAG: ABC transporter ATP-binding protein [Chloroflexota bacterium]